MADAKPESTTIHVNTEDLKEVEGDMCTPSFFVN